MVKYQGQIHEILKNVWSDITYVLLFLFKPKFGVMIVDIDKDYNFVKGQGYLVKGQGQIYVFRHHHFVQMYCLKIRYAQV